MDFKAILRTFLKIILPLAFGCLLLWYLYSKMDIGEIWNVIRKGVRYEIILFSLLFGLGANIVRGLRWGLLIRSLGDKEDLQCDLCCVGELCCEPCATTCR